MARGDHFVVHEFFLRAEVAREALFGSLDEVARVVHPGLHGLRVRPAARGVRAEPAGSGAVATLAAHAIAQIERFRARFGAGRESEWQARHFGASSDFPMPRMRPMRSPTGLVSALYARECLSCTTQMLYSFWKMRVSARGLTLPWQLVAAQPPGPTYLPVSLGAPAGREVAGEWRRAWSSAGRKCEGRERCGNQRQSKA